MLFKERQICQRGLTFLGKILVSRDMLRYQRSNCCVNRRDVGIFRIEEAFLKTDLVCSVFKRKNGQRMIPFLSEKNFFKKFDKYRKNYLK